MNNEKPGFNTGMGNLQIVPEIRLGGDGTEIPDGSKQIAIDGLQNAVRVATKSVLEAIEDCINNKEQLPTDIYIRVTTTSQLDSKKKTLKEQPNET